METKGKIEIKFNLEDSIYFIELRLDDILNGTIKSIEVHGFRDNPRVSYWLRTSFSDHYKVDQDDVYATYEEAKNAVRDRRIAQINKTIRDHQEEIQYWETKLANLTQE
jgi:hypothetical protein